MDGKIIYGVEFGGGWGRTSKTPTMDHLYPNKYYNDLVQ